MGLCWGARAASSIRRGLGGGPPFCGGRRAGQPRPVLPLGLGLTPRAGDRLLPCRVTACPRVFEKLLGDPARGVGGGGGEGGGGTR